MTKNLFISIICIIFAPELKTNKDLRLWTERFYADILVHC